MVYQKKYKVYWYLNKKICYEIQLLKTPKKNILKLIGNHNMFKRYIILWLHQITWKNVIDYNDYDYKLRLPGLMCQSEEVGLMCQEWRSWANVSEWRSGANVSDISPGNRNL
jgi:hypothetical protein